MDLQKILCLCEEMHKYANSEWQGRCDVLLNEIRNEILNSSRETLFELIKRAKNSEYGAVWYSDRGPIQITKEGELMPLLGHMIFARNVKGKKYHAFASKKMKNEIS